LYKITTDRLILRPFLKQDLDRIVSLAGEPPIMESMFALPQPCTDEVAESWIDGHARDFRAGRAFHFAIAESGAPDLPIGYMALMNINRDWEEAQLGFWIGFDSSGKGFATEAARGIIHFAFSTVLLNRVSALHKRRNTAAQKVLERAGMQREGVLRQRVRENHTFTDVCVWSILQQEWADDFDYGELNIQIEEQERVFL